MAPSAPRTRTSARHRSPYARPALRALAVALACLLGGALATDPARADDTYRWLDPEGRIHFGTSPPPDARELRKVDPAAGPSPIRVVPGIDAPRSTATRSPRGETPAARRLREAEESEPTSIGGRRRSQWREKARTLEQRVEQIEAQLEVAEDQLRSSHSLRRSAYYQRRIASLETRLEAARTTYRDFEDHARSLGVPPGWLR